MEFLRFLERLRTPLGDAFWSMATHLGEEMIFIFIGLLFFWCIDKKKGYFILSVGFLGTVMNQFLKLAFRIPRPWVRDPSFTIVESARAEATGYSFPSGHTQSAVGSFGSIARVSKNKYVRMLCIAACILVPISRMYLGVHTPADVGVSTVIAILLILILHPIIDLVTDSPKHMRIYLAVMSSLSIVFMVYVLCFPFPSDIDIRNLNSGIENAHKILGCILGLWLAYEIDIKYIRFNTTSAFKGQIIKLLLGLALLLAIKSGLKPLLLTIFDNKNVADAIRYFIIVIFAGCIWPMTFKYWQKIK